MKNTRYSIGYHKRDVIFCKMGKKKLVFIRFLTEKKRFDFMSITKYNTNTF